LTRWLKYGIKEAEHKQEELMASKISVRDYSLKGDWVVIGYPGGSILLPKSELSGVDYLYRDDVLGRAIAVTRGLRERFVRAWNYDDPRFEYNHHTVTYSVSLRMQTKPRTLEPKALFGEFEVALWWWEAPDGSLIIEEKERKKVEVRSSDHNVHLDVEDIPKELIDRMIAATELYLES